MQYKSNNHEYDLRQNRIREIEKVLDWLFTGLAVAVGILIGRFL